MKKIIIALALAATLASCAKNDDSPIDNPSTSGKYLKKVNYWTVASNAETTIREITVDASGNLTALKTFTTGGQGGTGSQLMAEYTSIEKDASGKVIKISGQDKMQNKALIYEFTYDATGNITKAVLKQDGAVYQTSNYTYDASNRLVKVDEIASNNKVVLVKTYTYTGSSVNPATVTDDQVLYNQVTSTSLKFDDKKNPSQAAPKALFAMGMVDFYKNNVIESKDGTKTTTVTVTYNSDGYAASTTNGSGSGLKFVYGN